MRSPAAARCWALGAGGGGFFGDDEVFVGFAGRFELHFVFGDGEFDAGVDGKQRLVAGFLLADVVFGGAGADDVFLAQEIQALLASRALGAAGDGIFGNERAVLGRVGSPRESSERDDRSEQE
jgi:hypothetical protein